MGSGSCSCCPPSHEGSRLAQGHCAPHCPLVVGSLDPGDWGSSDSGFHQVWGCVPFPLQVGRQIAWGSCCS
uniref:Uncharacterized protein n=1 Tax=Arundo donax TaxID=35708 RepID=A0A0A8Z7W5_ARUDO